MPRLSGVWAIAVLLAISAESVWAIEKFSFISTADVVVGGQLKLSSYFLSFDGLHVNGRIAASEVLYGGGPTNSNFEYHVVVPRIAGLNDGPWVCSLRDALSGVCSYWNIWRHWSETKEFILQTQIWALIKGPGSSWTSADPELAFIYHAADRDKVIEVLQRRKQLVPKP